MTADCRPLACTASCISLAPQQGVRPLAFARQLLVDVERFEDIAGLIERLQPALQQAFPMADVKVWKFMLGRGGAKKIEAVFR